MHPITRRHGLGLLAGGLAAPFLSGKARAADTVTIGVQFGLPYLPFLVAEAEGLFARHAKAQGAEVTFDIRRLGGPSALTDGLFAGSVDIAALGMLPLLIGYAKTRGNFAMGGISAYWKGTYTIYANDPAIRSVKDIRPTDKIALPGPTSSQALVLRRAAAKLFGPSEAKRFDDQIVTLPHPEAVAALASGKAVQVYFATSPFNEVLARTANVHVIGTSDDFNPPEMTNGVVAGLEKFVRAKPAVVRAFLDALAEADAFVAAEPRRTAEIYFRAEPAKLTEDQQIEMIRANAAEYVTRPNGVVETARFMKELGQLAEVPARWQDVFFPPINQGAGS
ncbi:ABC transporter substrate-binding protein [Siculibacillus lacustris]|nr:ABC transporter substrate-binding protein [Siculibacillus lacustris]